MSLSKLFAADQNINPAFRAAVVPTLPPSDYDVALDYACTQKLMGDIRNFLREQPPIICKMIELFGAQCFVGGKTRRAKEILAMTRHYNWEVNPARKCPDCDGHRVHWTDGNADLAECPDCGACSDPDCSAAVL